MEKIRTRLAPSPTGFLHIGTARTALFNYLFAKKHNGEFILRIEDTDLERSDPKYEKDIFEGLKWLGITADESPIAYTQNQKSRERRDSLQTAKIKNQKYIGEYGPYRQSERTETYKKYIRRLLADRKAFYCFHSEIELKEEKENLLKAKRPPLHLCAYREMDPAEADILKEAKKKYIVRFKTPVGQKITFTDLIRGKLSFDSSLLGDFSVAKDLDTPLYNFAVVIDDYEMKISHVIRGEDHISNTPKQILLLEALGFNKPQYAHLPLILGFDRSKLSKRHGATSVNEYKEAGYLPEALFNFLALLGWNPATKILTAVEEKTNLPPKDKTIESDAPAYSGQQTKGLNLVRGKPREKEQEIFSRKELIELFSLEKVQKSGAIFDVQKLDWMNGEYIRKKSAAELIELCKPYLEYFLQFSKEYIEKVIALEQPRLKKLSEIREKTDYFFQEPKYDKELLRWKNMIEEEIKTSLEQSEKIISSFKTQISKEEIGEAFLKEIGAGDKGQVLWPLRVALTGKKASPGPFEIIEVLGIEKSIKRLKSAQEILRGSTL